MQSSKNPGSSTAALERALHPAGELPRPAAGLPSGPVGAAPHVEELEWSNDHATVFPDGRIFIPQLKAYTYRGLLIDNGEKNYVDLDDRYSAFVLAKKKQLLLLSNKTIQVWDIADKQFKKISQFQNPVQDRLYPDEFFFDPNENYVAMLTRESRIYSGAVPHGDEENDPSHLHIVDISNSDQWKVLSKTRLKTSELSFQERSLDYVYSLAFSSDGKKLAFLKSSSEVYLYDISNPAQPKFEERIACRNDRVHSGWVCFSADAKRLILATQRSIKKGSWDTESYLEIVDIATKTNLSTSKLPSRTHLYGHISEEKEDNLILLYNAPYKEPQPLALLNVDNPEAPKVTHKTSVRESISKTPGCIIKMPYKSSPLAHFQVITHAEWKLAEKVSVVPEAEQKDFLTVLSREAALRKLSQPEAPADVVPAYDGPMSAGPM